MRAVLLLALVLLISGVAIAPALAGVTKQIAVQGMLTKGSIIFGTTVKFEIFNNSGGTGSPICTVPKNDIAAATNGIFTTLLDLSSCTTLDFSTDYWTKITIGTGAGSELGPLQRLTPAPYALALPGLVSKDGKIGIGMTGPTSKLQIYDDENAEIFSGSPVRAGFMAVGGPGTVALYSNEAGQQLSILSNAAGAYWELGLHETIPDFAIWDTDAPRFVIQNNTGNVGIGTTIPQAKLDVNGDIRINNAVLKFDIGGNIWRIVQGAQALGTPLHIQSVTLGEEENPVTAITFTRDGKVGIGTATPSEKLEIAGNAKIDGDLKINGRIDILPSKGMTVGGLSIVQVAVAGAPTPSATLMSGGSLAQNTDFRYAVSAMFSGGYEGQAVSTQLVNPGTTSFRKSSITWNAVANATYYKVYGRNGTAGATLGLLGNTTGLFFEDDSTLPVGAAPNQSVRTDISGAGIISADKIIATSDLIADSNTWGSCYTATYGTPSGACDGHASCANGYFMKGFYLSQGNSVNCVLAECCKL